MAYNLACWCIQMAYTQHSWMLMDIVVGLSVRPSVRLFVYGIFRWLCICWQITWNKWHKIWHDDVVIIGRWLLPSVVDTGDICCHYWQLILVIYHKIIVSKLQPHHPRVNELMRSDCILHVLKSLPWCQNERDGVSNHQLPDCLLNCLFKHRSNKTSKLRITGLCEGNSPVTGEFPTQRASNTENVSIWWRNHVIMQCMKSNCHVFPPPPLSLGHWVFIMEIIITVSVGLLNEESVNYDPMQTLKSIKIVMTLWLN